MLHPFWDYFKYKRTHPKETTHPKTNHQKNHLQPSPPPPQKKNKKSPNQPPPKSPNPTVCTIPPFCCRLRTSIICHLVGVGLWWPYLLCSSPRFLMFPFMALVTFLKEAVLKDMTLTKHICLSYLRSVYQNSTFFTRLLRAVHVVCVCIWVCVFKKKYVSVDCSVSCREYCWNTVTLFLYQRAKVTTKILL